MGPEETTTRQWDSEGSERHRIAAPVQFYWKTPTGEWRQGKGTTQYITDRSLSVLCHPVPIPGAIVRVRVELPPAGVIKRLRVLCGEGLVTRVQPESGQPYGFDALVVLDDEECDCVPPQRSD